MAQQNRLTYSRNAAKLRYATKASGLCLAFLWLTFRLFGQGWIITNRSTFWSTAMKLILWAVGITFGFFTTPAAASTTTLQCEMLEGFFQVTFEPTGGPADVAYTLPEAAGGTGQTTGDMRLTPQTATLEFSVMTAVILVRYSIQIDRSNLGYRGKFAMTGSMSGTQSYPMRDGKCALVELPERQNKF